MWEETRKIKVEKRRERTFRHASIAFSLPRQCSSVTLSLHLLYLASSVSFIPPLSLFSSFFYLFALTITHDLFNPASTAKQLQKPAERRCATSRVRAFHNTIAPPPLFLFLSRATHDTLRETNTRITYNLRIARTKPSNQCKSQSQCFQNNTTLDKTHISGYCSFVDDYYISPCNAITVHENGIGQYYNYKMHFKCQLQVNYRLINLYEMAKIIVELKPNHKRNEICIEENERRTVYFSSHILWATWFPRKER